MAGCAVDGGLWRALGGRFMRGPGKPLPYAPTTLPLLSRSLLPALPLHCRGYKGTVMLCRDLS